MKIFFDFDGTLVDSRQRLYGLFQHLVDQSKLTFEDYWDLKRSKVGHKGNTFTRFSYTPEKYELFIEEWMKKIELPEWLSFDTPFAGVTEFLEELSRCHTLYIVTARQFTTNILEQIESFGWTKFFEQIFVTNQLLEKAELLKDFPLDKDDWLISDTGSDINAGKKLGLKTVGVSCGFLSQEKLKEYKPDLLLERVQDFAPDIK